jgi:hypothetical protein
MWNPKQRLAQFVHKGCKLPEVSGCFPFSLSLEDVFQKQVKYSVVTLDQTARSADEQAAWTIFERVSTEEWARCGFSRKKWAGFGFEPKPDAMPARSSAGEGWDAFLPSQVQRIVATPAPPAPALTPPNSLAESIKQTLWQRTRTAQGGMCISCRTALPSEPTVDNLGRLRPKLYTSTVNGNVIPCRNCDTISFQSEWFSGKYARR